MCTHVFNQVRIFVTPWTVAHQAPLSMGFSRHEYWSGLPCPPAGDPPSPEMEPQSLSSPALAGGLFPTSTTCCLARKLQILELHNVSLRGFFLPFLPSINVHRPCWKQPLPTTASLKMWLEKRVRDCYLIVLPESRWQEKIFSSPHIPWDAKAWFTISWVLNMRAQRNSIPARMMMPPHETINSHLKTSDYRTKGTSERNLLAKETTFLSSKAWTE